MGRNSVVDNKDDGKEEKIEAGIERFRESQTHMVHHNTNNFIPSNCTTNTKQLFSIARHFISYSLVQMLSPHTSRLNQLTGTGQTQSLRGHKDILVSFNLVSHMQSNHF